jgi:hypothetical protein
MTWKSNNPNPKPKKHTAPSKWTNKEVIVLKRLAGREPLWRISQTLGRSELSIRWKAKKEGIQLSWTEFRRPNS